MIKTTGHEKTHFIVVLGCMANGDKIASHDHIQEEDVSPEPLKEWRELVGEADDDENFEGFLSHFSISSSDYIVTFIVMFWDSVLYFTSFQT